MTTAPLGGRHRRRGPMARLGSCWHRDPSQRAAPEDRLVASPVPVAKCCNTRPSHPAINQQARRRQAAKVLYMCHASTRQWYPGDRQYHQVACAPPPLSLQLQVQLMNRKQENLHKPMQLAST